MTTDKGKRTTTITLAGESYRLRYEFLDWMAVESLLGAAALGARSKKFLDLVDPPYSATEIMILLEAGINAAYRLDEREERITTSEVQTLVQRHYDGLYKTCKDLKGWQEANSKMLGTISEAVRTAVGLNPNHLTPKKIEALPKEKASPSVMNEPLSSD